MTFLNELKRRHVFRAGGAFLVLMWALLQVTDVVAPALGLPEWVLTVEIVLAIIGLPIVLLMAWVYELTPAGLQKTEELSTHDLVARPAGPGRWAELTVFVILLVAVAYLLTDKLHFEDSAESPFTDDDVAIAVLPFDNLSGDPEQAYFADGVAEEILNSLATIPQMRVISRTSSFALRDQNLSIAEIARVLGVDYVVEGSVRRDESTVRITAQLIRAATDTHLWSDTFDRVLGADEILGIQEIIARNIADRLRVRVVPDELTRSSPPSSFEALDAYLDGLTSIRSLHSHTADFSDAFFLTATEKMEASVRADPQWAPSRAALGLLWHWWMSANSNVNDEERWQTSYDYIQSAISIDPDYGPAWGSLAFLHNYKGDYAEALDAMGHLKKLGANGSIMQAYILNDMAHHEASIEYFDKAIALNPMSDLFRSQRANLLVCVGRFEEAIREQEAIMAMFADSGQRAWGGLLFTAYAHAKLGNHDKAREILAEWADVGGSKVETALIYALVGMTDIADSLLTKAEESGDLQIFPIVPTAAALGQTERAWAQLERVMDKNPRALRGFPCLEESKLLRSDPRFLELQTIAGIPEEYR